MRSNFPAKKEKGAKITEKKVPLFGKLRGEEAGEIQGNRFVSTVLLYLLLIYLNSTSIIDIFLSYTVYLKKWTDSYRTLSYMSFTENV